MLKLLLVDDESTIRKGMRTCIDWAQSGVELIGAACDGAQAYEMAQKLYPDIILTDIRMPVMDGIELTGLLRKALPDCKVIIMSGYDEFDYAKRLMGMQVTDYLLKPVDETELRGVLFRIAGEIQWEKRQKSSQEAVAWLRYENTPQLKAKFMQRLLQGQFSTESEIVHWGTVLKMKLTLKDRYLTVLTLALDPLAPPTKTRSAEEERLTNFAISNIADEIINEQNSGFLCYGEEFPHFVGLLSQKLDSATVTEHIMARIKALIKEYLDQRVFVCSGAIAPGIENLSQSYEQSMELLNESLYKGKRNFVKAALRYMKENYNKDISLAEVAREACVTPNYLSRIFKEEIDSNFVDWLNHLRISRAKELLTTSNLKTYEIAEQIGFKNYKYFTSVFKKLTGCTPREYSDSE